MYEQEIHWNCLPRVYPTSHLLASGLPERVEYPLPIPARISRALKMNGWADIVAMSIHREGRLKGTHGLLCQKPYLVDL